MYQLQPYGRCFERAAYIGVEDSQATETGDKQQRS